MNESLSMIESRLAARDATGARLAADALLAQRELPPEDRVAALKLRNGGRVVDAALLAHTVVLGCRSCRDGLNASVAGYEFVIVICHKGATTDRLAFGDRR